MNTVIKRVGTFLDRNSPVIFAGFAVGGVLSTAYLSAKAAPEALEELERARAVKVLRGGGNDIDDIDLTSREIVEAVWKIYAPTAISIGLTVASIVLSHKVSARRTAAIASAYSILETGLHEYQAKALAMLGERKEQQLRTSIHEDRMREDPVQNKEIIRTGLGEYLFYDSLSGRYFLSDVEKVRRVQNEFNHQLLSDMYLPLNDFYMDLGLEGIEMGRNMGWNAENGLLEVKFIPILASTGEPCVCLEYAYQPRFL